MPPGFRTINNPYLTPLGAQLVITGIPQFNAAALNIQRQFQSIGMAATAVATQITALNTSLAAFNAHARTLQTIGQRAQQVSAVSAAARGIPTVRPGGSSRGSNPLGALGSVEPGGQARAFFGQRLGPLSVYTRLPVTLNATAVAALAAAAGITAIGAKLQQTSRQVQVFGNLSEQQMGDVKAAAIGMSREFTASANDIAQGALQLAKAGAPLNDLNNNILRSVTVLNQASQGEVNMADASDTVIQGITALNLKWAEAPKFVGGLIAAVQGSTASFSDFTLQLKQTLPVAGLLKFNYDELFASLALLNQAGLRGSIAGTALKNALIAIADPTSEAGEILRKYNISLFDASGKALPLIEVLGRLVDAFGKTNEGISDAQKFFETTDIFNTRQILAALSIINQGNSAYAGFLATVRGGVNTGEQVAKSLQNNLIDQLDLIKNNAVAAAEAIASEFLPALTGMASRIRESLSAGNLQGFKDFGKNLNDILILNDKDAKNFVTTLFGVAHAATETSNITTEALRKASAASTDLGVALNKSLVQAATIDLPKFKSEAQESFKLSSEALEKWVKQTEDADARVNKALTAIATTVVVGMTIINKALSGGGGSSINPDPENAMIERASLADALLANFVDHLRVPYKAVGALADLITELFSFGDKPELNRLFPDVEQEFSVARRHVAEAGKFVTATTENILTSIAAGYEAAGNAIVGTTDRIISAYNIGIQAGREFTDSINAAGRAASLPPMSNSMGFWDLPGVLPTASVARPPIGLGSSFPPSKPGGGGGGAGDELEKIAAQVRAALSGIPALTEDLVDFIASIAQDTPARLAPMLAAINSSSSIIAELVIAKRDLLATDLQLIGIEQRLTELNAQSAQLDIERAIAVIGFDKQLIAINQQLLVVDQQRWPIEDAMRLVDREISRLGQENLAIKRELLDIELQQLPGRQRIEDIEQEISKHNRTNFDVEKRRLELTLATIGIRHQLEDIETRIAALNQTNFANQREQLRGELAALPVRQRIRDIEQQITDSVDKRANIQSRLSELDLADIEDELAGAWATNDVSTILRLEEEKALIEARLKGDEKAERAAERVRLGLELQKVALEDQLKPIERRLQLLGDTEEKERLLAEIARTFLEEEKQRLEALIKPRDDLLKIIERQTEIERIRTELVLLALERERQAILDQLIPLDQKRQAIERELAAENLRNQILITHLEEEKRRLEAQLIPLEDQRRAIERIKQEVEFLRASAQVEFDERSIMIREMVLQEQLRQAELEATRREQELLFGKLVLGFADSLTASEAFTGGEALEVAQRLKLWDDSIAKLAETIVEFQRLSRAAGDAAKSIKEIERNVTVTITTVHRTVFESAGVPPAAQADPGVQQFAGGGIVPGRRGEPMLIMAHGGERIISVTNASVPSHISAKQAGSVTNISNHYETNYNVNPSYSSYQSPAALTDDLRALIVASSRG